jgi:hypothetical protein
MPNRVKVYVSLIVGLGLIVLGGVFSQDLPGFSLRFGIYLALAAAASLIKLRLPGVDGAYSLSFFFILAGLCYFGLAEALLVAGLCAISATLVAREHRPTVLQAAFNAANVFVSVGICAWLASSLRYAGLEPHHPAALAALSFCYFVVNTGVVSTVLSLLEGKSLWRVCQEWYPWSLPYYVVGVVIVGLLPLAGKPVHPAGWLATLPPLYLLHFFCGLKHHNGGENSADDEAATLQLPKPAKIYIAVVVGASGLLLSWGLLGWEVGGWAKLLAFLAAAIPASFLKIRLPGVTGTVSLSFVVQLLALVELTLPELLLVACVSAAVQSIWGSQYRPAPVQVLFNVAVLALSAGLSYAVFQGCQTSFSQPLLISLAAAAAVLYFADTLLVAAVLCLVEEKPLTAMWQGCYFWSFPYYLVGTTFAAVMSSIGASEGWMVSFLALPLMALMYLSYRLQLGAVSLRPPNG